jgi:hypothetical protein
LAGSHALAQQLDKQLGVGFAVEQALLIHFGVDRLSDQGKGQSTTAPGAVRKTLKPSSQTLRRAAGAAHGCGQRIDFALAGQRKYLGGQLALAAHMAVQTAGGDADILSQGLHGQRGKTALDHPHQRGTDDAGAQRLIAVESVCSGAVGHGLNPDSRPFK